MRWRNGETVGVEMSMVLLLSMNEADCLDQQDRRTSEQRTTKHHNSRRSAYRECGGTSHLPVTVSKHQD